MSIYRGLMMGAAVAAATFTLPGAQISGIHDPDNLNPAYSLVEFHPAAWIPQVVDMAMMADGKLAVLTLDVKLENTTNKPDTSGALYIVGNLSAATPEGFDVKTIATKLHEPTGMAVVNGKIYVTEKLQLTEFTLDAAGTTATTRKVTDFAVDPIGIVNFQEWALGLLYKDGYFYTGLGGGVRLGGKSWIDDTTKLVEPKRAGLLKISAADGTSELIAGGLRAPNGITWGPDGSSIWVTDNQGSFLPSCKLVKITEGKNYGYPNGPNKYRHMEETGPNVWYPYGEVGKSTTHPMFLKNGTFAGQVLIGDLSLGGVTRTALETVNGEMQGSVHSFSGGFAAGTQKMLEMADGSILVAGLGRGDLQNWGWKGKKVGLQKLTAKAGTVNFEMYAVRSKAGGMEIEFTKPVGTGADLPASYAVTSATMVPAPEYGGGNMVGRKIVAVSAVTLSDDKKRAFLKIDGLAAKTVVSIKVTGVTSATAEALYRPAAWYTLNSVSTAPFVTTTAIRQGTARAEVLSAYEIRAHRTGRNLSVTVPFAGGHVLTLRTTQGRILESHAGNGPSEYLLGKAGFAPGIYLIDVKVAGQLLHKSVVF
jgi:glucose/arabinose dehydrogenase